MQIITNQYLAGNLLCRIPYPIKSNMYEEIPSHAIRKFIGMKLGLNNPQQPRRNCRDKLATDPDKFVIPSDRLTVDLWPGSDRPEFAWVVVTRKRNYMPYKVWHQRFCSICEGIYFISSHILQEML